MPELDNLIKAMDCEEYKESVCKNCPYGYQKWDDHGDYPYWTCDEERLREDATGYLKLYQHLINEKG